MSFLLFSLYIRGEGAESMDSVNDAHFEIQRTISEDILEGFK